MIHQRHRQMDGQTTCDRKTAFFTIVHRTVKSLQYSLTHCVHFQTSSVKYLQLGPHTRAFWPPLLTIRPRWVRLRHRVRLLLCMYKSWTLGWQQRTARRVASHPVVTAWHWEWSTGDDRLSTVDNTWWRSTCFKEINLSSEAGKSSRGIMLMFGDIQISCLINTLKLQGALFPRPCRSFGSSEGTTLGPIYIYWLEVPTHNDCIELPL